MSTYAVVISKKGWRQWWWHVIHKGSGHASTEARARKKAAACILRDQPTEFEDWKVEDARKTYFEGAK